MILTITFFISRTRKKIYQYAVPTQCATKLTYTTKINHGLKDNAVVQDITFAKGNYHQHTINTTNENNII